MGERVQLFVAHSPEHRPRERAEAMDAIRALGQTWPLHEHVNADNNDYSRALASVWNEPTTLIILEHDMVCEAEHIRKLLACPFSCCAWLYWMYSASTGHLSPILSCQPERFGITTDTSLSGSFATYSGIGCVKLASGRGGTIPTCDYHDVEYYVNTQKSQPWHLHGPPMTHLHGQQEIRNAKRACLVTR